MEAIIVLSTMSAFAIGVIIYKLITDKKHLTQPPKIL